VASSELGFGIPRFTGANGADGLFNVRASCPITIIISSNSSMIGMTSADDLTKNYK